MRVIPVSLVCGVLVGVVLAAAAGADASSASTKCPAFTATPWQSPFTTKTVKGDTYIVTNNGTKYSCAQLESFVKKLVAERVPKTIPLQIKGVPSGWYCTATADKEGLAFNGGCRPSRLAITGPNFAWTTPD